mmetsp:Transcript_13712/g.26891  ORF Transcript_13712/g.26891 Transcript_13712/m.26891 type:complete len:391 (+) Transcript_13712:91-1263(+)
MPVQHRRGGRGRGARAGEFQPVRQVMLQPHTRYLGRVVRVFPQSAKIDIGWKVLGTLPRRCLLPGAYKVEHNPFAEEEENAFTERLVHERIPRNKDVRDYLEEGDVVAVLVTRYSQNQVTLARAPRKQPEKKQTKEAQPKMPQQTNDNRTSLASMPSGKALHTAALKPPLVGPRPAFAAPALADVKRRGPMRKNDPSLSLFSHSAVVSATSTRPNSLATSPESRYSEARDAQRKPGPSTVVTEVVVPAEDVRSVASSTASAASSRMQRKKATRVPRKTLEEMKRGQMCRGVVTSIHSFGAFVDIGAEKEGLVPFGELRYWNNSLVRPRGPQFPSPFDIVTTGETLVVEVERLDKRKRRIGLRIIPDKRNFEACVKPGNYHDDNEFPALAA